MNSTYHKILRVSAVVCALVLVFESGLINNYTAELADITADNLTAMVSMSASVQPTELNQMTAAITEKEKELAEREAALQQREIEVGLGDGGTESNVSTYVLSSVLFILLVLILLNYALDYLRSREEKEVAAV